MQGAGQQEATCGFLNLHHQVPLCSSALWFWWEIPFRSQLRARSYTASRSVLVMTRTARSWFVCYSRGRSLPENLVHKYNVGDRKHPSCLWDLILCFWRWFAVQPALFGVTNTHVRTALSLGLLECLNFSLLDFRTTSLSMRANLPCTRQAERRKLACFSVHEHRAPLCPFLQRGEQDA